MVDNYDVDIRQVAANALNHQPLRNTPPEQPWAVGRNTDPTDARRALIETLRSWSIPKEHEQQARSETPSDSAIAAGPVIIVDKLLKSCFDRSSPSDSGTCAEICSAIRHDRSAPRLRCGEPVPICMPSAMTRTFSSFSDQATQQMSPIGASPNRGYAAGRTITAIVASDAHEIIPARPGSSFR